jgi:4-aminobutyrate aminotransferase/4-aminobutyrate aminotransferase/(S)-3-amino-2-methylpropionate transaminase
MLGVFIQDENGGPDATLCDLLLENLKDHGVFAGKTGPGRNTLTFMPPLTVTEQEIGKFAVAFRRSIEGIR